MLGSQQRIQLQTNQELANNLQETRNELVRKEQDCETRVDALHLELGMEAGLSNEAAANWKRQALQWMLEAIRCNGKAVRAAGRSNRSEIKAAGA